MNETFMKRLTTSLTPEKAGAVTRLLLLRNIEVYIRDPKQKGSFQFVEEETEQTGGCLYVPEADYAHARRVLIREGYEEIISRNPEVRDEVKDPLQQVQEDYMRRRKMHMIEWAVILTAVILYGLIRSRF